MQNRTNRQRECPRKEQQINNEQKTKDIISSPLILVITNDFFITKFFFPFNLGKIKVFLGEEFGIF